MYTDINYNEYLELVLKQIPKGIFITVKTNEEVNTMVLGWGHIGYIWGKKVFVAYIRTSRHTYKLLEVAKEFTISVPIENNLRNELKFCGENSGRDVNKFVACELSLVNGRQINSPIISDCELHYECKVIHKQIITENNLDEIIKNKFYEDNDYHIAYYGEIVDSYLFKRN